MDRGRAAALATGLGISRAGVYQWIKGIRPVPVRFCASIEQLTAGAVTRQMLRPDDWAEIWPELAAVAAHDGAA